MLTLAREAFFIAVHKARSAFFSRKRLVAKEGLRKISLSNKTFYSDPEGDPYFYLDQNSYNGWYLLEFFLTTSIVVNQKHLAKLYVDIGSGFSETDVVMIPFTMCKKVKRFVWLPIGARTLRFDPVESDIGICIEYFDFKPVFSYFALNRMLNKLANFHNKDSNKLYEFYLKKTIKPKAVLELIYRDYNKIFEFSKIDTEKAYQNWIHEVENCTLVLNGKDINFLTKPIFSIIVPVYNPNLEFLSKAIASIEKQTYPYWELCLADDASNDSTVKEWLSTYSRYNPKVKLCFRESNGHISAASNSALAMASGDYVVLLDQDDELAENALWLVADAIQRNSQAKIIYSDEDKIDEYGNRFEPHFKPDWNPDLFYSNNYISHLGVYDRQLVLKVGGFRVGVEGAQDYDLCLRCVAALEGDLNKAIIHLPHILYHWRTLEGSTAKQSSAKSYTWDAGLKALSDYLSVAKIEAEAEKAELPNTYRVKYKHKQPLVSLIIPTRDQVGVLETCLTSLLEKTDYKNYEIIVVDNQSQEITTKKYFEKIAKHSKVRVLNYPHSFNYSAINNFAAAQANGFILGLLNNDVEVISPDWLDEMVMHVSRPEIGCVGAKLLYPDNRIQHAGIALGVGGIAGHTHRLFHKDHPGYFGRLKLVQNFSAVTAACLLVRTELYNQVNGLDAENLTVAFNDVDFCLRIRELGYRNLWTPYALLYHHESLSRGSDDTPEKAKRFAQEIRYMLTKWGSILFSDPYYHAAFSLKLNDFSLDTNENSDFIAGFKNFYLSN